jgi:hypothetical protein
MIFEKQTTEQGKHYLYQHIRLDTNEPFYIGIGTKYNHNKDYTRAKAYGTQRNNIWRGIVSRTDYNVIILHESNDYDFIKSKEIEYINKYGQIIKNTGTLCNLTDGGDGVLGVRNMELIKPVYLYHKTGEFFKEFEAYADCTKYLKIHKSVVPLSVDKNHLIKGYILKSYKIDKVEPILDIKEKLAERLSKPVYQYDKDMNLIKEWSSTSEASRTLGISGGHIRECANGTQTANKGTTKRNTAGGFRWKYEKIEK